MNANVQSVQAYVPSRKVSSSALAGAISITVVWAVNNFAMPTGTEIPGEVASALTTILSSLVGYLVPESA